MSIGNQIQSRHYDIVGLIPAAGTAKRLGRLPCSKELLPIRIHNEDKNDVSQVKVVSHYLIEKMRRANVSKAFMILRKGKWDIPAYFGNGKNMGIPVAYLMMDLPFGVPYTIDQAYEFVSASLVVFGFPDILFEPEDAFVQLISKQNETGADIVLGIFAADQPNMVDMVDIDENGCVRGIYVKPAATRLHYTWIIAVWTPAFTRYLHEFIANDKARYTCNGGLQSDQNYQELYLGSVIDSAIKEGFRSDSVIFNNNRFLDIGIPENLLKAHQF